MWNRGWCQMSWPAWHNLQRRIEELWEDAERLSEEAGVEYKDRYGNWRFPKKADSSFVGKILKLYCEAKGITFS